MKRTVDQAAFSNSCTFGQGSGARFLNGAASASVMRSKIAALTDGRVRIRAHHSATDWVAVPHAAELEEFEPQNIGNHSAVCVGKTLAGQVRTALQRVRHPRQQFSVMRQRLGHELGVKPVLDDAALVLGAALERRLVDFGLPGLWRHLAGKPGGMPLRM